MGKALEGGAFYFTQLPHGEIASILHEDGAAAWAVNVKRGIVSALQVHLPSSPAATPAASNTTTGAAAGSVVAYDVEEADAAGQTARPPLPPATGGTSTP